MAPQCQFVHGRLLSILEGLLELDPLFAVSAGCTLPNSSFLQPHRMGPLSLNIPAFANSVPSAMGALWVLSLQINSGIAVKDHFTPLQFLGFLFLWYMPMALTVSVYLTVMRISIIN